MKVTLSKSTARNVSFTNTQKPVTIKTSAAAATLGTLSDIDLTNEEAKVSGATLIYDEGTKTYKAEKVFEYDGDQVTLKGGSF